MGRYKQQIQDELDKAHYDYAECKIEQQEFLAGITAWYYTTAGYTGAYG